MPLGGFINIRANLFGEITGADPNETAGAFRGMADMLRRWNGEGQDPAERVVTVGELERPLRKLGIQIGADGALADVTGGSVGVVEAATPGSLSATGVFEMVILSWSVSTKGLAYVEIWRSQTDNLSTATLRGLAPSQTFADDARADTTYYYWVRSVSTSGKKSAFNDTNGVEATTSLDPRYVRDQITAGDWAATTAFGSLEIVTPRDGGGDLIVDSNGVPLSFQATVGGISAATEPTWPTTLGATVVDGSVTWQAVDAGKAPLIVGTRNGQSVVVMPGAFIEDATITDAKIKNLAAEKIEAGTITAAIGLTAATITGGSLNINDRFVVASNGDTTITSADTGARLEIRNNVIKVFDSSGVLRVQMGDLTA